MLKKGDIILASVLVFTTLASYLWIGVIKKQNSSLEKVAVIKQDESVVRRIKLDKVQQPEKIEIKGKYTDVILVEKGRIRFEDADCPDLVCVRTGWLTGAGDMAVCIPNQAVIKIEGENPEVDGVTF